MAGDWIKMRGNLWDDPRVARICDRTDQVEAMVIGGLYWLWATADQHTEDGVMPGLTIRQIDRKTGIAGFGNALCAIGWLADHPEGVRIIKFEEHNGSSAKKRCQTAKRVSKFKNDNAAVTQQALPKEPDSVSSALPREEKRREDISTSLRSVDTAPEGVDAQVWLDFQKLRKAKKAPLTESAIAGIRTEASKAGMTLMQALSECCQRGWTGFKAEWIVKDRGPPARASPSDAKAREQERVIRELDAWKPPKQPGFTGETIDV
jgi:hypothetical protein